MLEVPGTTVRLGQIKADSVFYRHFAILPSLQSLSRDAVLVSLITNNTRDISILVAEYTFQSFSTIVTSHFCIVTSHYGHIW